MTWPAIEGSSWLLLSLWWEACSRGHGLRMLHVIEDQGTCWMLLGPLANAGFSAQQITFKMQCIGCCLMPREHVLHLALLFPSSILLLVAIGASGWTTDRAAQGCKQAQFPLKLCSCPCRTPFALTHAPAMQNKCRQWSIGRPTVCPSHP